MISFSCLILTLKDRHRSGRRGLGACRCKLLGNPIDVWPAQCDSNIDAGEGRGPMIPRFQVSASNQRPVALSPSARMFRDGHEVWPEQEQSIVKRKRGEMG